jgi:hypothetical protein
MRYQDILLTPIIGLGDPEYPESETKLIQKTIEKDDKENI